MARWAGPVAGGYCQGRSNNVPAGRSKIGSLGMIPREVSRVVPVVHRKDPHAAECPHEADAAARLGGTHRGSLGLGV